MNTKPVIKANVCLSSPQHFMVKTTETLKGRGIKETHCSVPGYKKYRVTEKAFEKLKGKYDVDFENYFC